VIGGGTRRTIDGTSKGKIVQKTNNATNISKALADNTKLTLREEFKDNSLSYRGDEEVGFFE
jgi:hypothetical protein